MIVKTACSRGSPVVLALAAIACMEGADPEGAASASYGRPFELAAGERARVAGDVLVTFARVRECPEGDECVGAGSAAAVFTVEAEAGSATLTLHTGREPRRASAAGHTLELLELRPGPERYEVTVVVTPAP